MKRKVEFIESYIKVGNDYQWHDNHGELIRCKDCKNNPKWSWVGCPLSGCGLRTDEWYCPAGKPKENEK